MRQRGSFAGMQCLIFEPSSLQTSSQSVAVFAPRKCRNGIRMAGLDWFGHFRSMPWMISLFYARGLLQIWFKPSLEPSSDARPCSPQRRCPRLRWLWILRREEPWKPFAERRQDQPQARPKISFGYDGRFSKQQGADLTRGSWCGKCGKDSPSAHRHARRGRNPKGQRSDRALKDGNASSWQVCSGGGRYPIHQQLGELRAGEGERLGRVSSSQLDWGLPRRDEPSR